MIGCPKPKLSPKPPRSGIARGKFTARKSPFQSKEWKKLRLLCKRAAKGVCVCGKHPGTQAHHLRYGPGRGLSRIIVPVEWLVWLSDECHAARHPVGVKQVKIRTEDGGYRYDNDNQEFAA